MLGKLKKVIIVLLNVVDGVKSHNHLLTQSDIDQMRRIMVR